MVTTTKEPTTAELLDVKDVAALLACSTRHVLRQSDSGRMPPGLKIGGLRRWRRQELSAWIEAGCPATRIARGGCR